MISEYIKCKCEFLGLVTVSIYLNTLHTFLIKSVIKSLIVTVIND
jgi:hypothetical protein